MYFHSFYGIVENKSALLWTVTAATIGPGSPFWPLDKHNNQTHFCHSLSLITTTHFALLSVLQKTKKYKGPGKYKSSEWLLEKLAISKCLGFCKRCLKYWHIQLWKRKHVVLFFANVFWCKILSRNCFHKHDIHNLIYIIIYLKKKKLRHGNVKSVETISRGSNNHKTHAKKITLFFVPFWRF